MLITFIIFALLVPLMKYLFLPKQKISSFIYAIVPFAVIQVLTPIMITYSGLLIDSVKILYIVIMCLWMAFFIGYCLFNLFKNKKDSNWNIDWKLALKKYAPVFIGMMTFIIISIFASSYYSDTEAYLTASYRYLNNQSISFDGVGGVGNHYLSLGMITAYPALFGDSLEWTYYFLNPFLTVFAIVIFTHEFFWNKFCKKELNTPNFLIAFGLSFAIGISSAFLTSYMTSGNIFIQSAILFMAFTVILDDEQENWTISVLLIFLCFMSATAFVTGPLIIIALVIYSFFFKNIWEVIKIMSMGSFALCIPLYAFTSGSKSNLLMILSYVALLMSMCLFIASFFMKKKFDKFFSWNCKILNHNSKNFMIANIAIWMISSILVVVLFGFVYNANSYYMRWLVFANLALSIILSCGIYFNWKKTGEVKQVMHFPLICTLISICSVILFIAVGTKNASIWRIIYLNFGMGSPFDVVLQAFVIIVTLFDFDLKINKDENKEKISWFKMSNRWISGSFAVILSFFSIGFNIYNLIPGNVRLFKYGSDVVVNIKKVNDSEISYLKSLPQGSLLTDIQVFYFLSNNVNKNNAIYNSAYPGSIYNNCASNSSWGISAMDFVGIVRYSYDIPEEEIAKNVVERLKGMLSSTNADKVDYIILDKTTKYYNEMISSTESYSEVKIMDNIAVIHA
ncbi:MAG: hypothetical protein ACRC42_01025 [Mycoplasma sp.]